MLGRDPLANVEPLVKRVYAYVAHRLGDGPDAEDVTNTVFENALRYRDTYDARKGTPLTWLLGIARRCVAQALVGRPESAAELPDVAAAGDLETDAVERLVLEDALTGLSERDRDLLALRYGADLSARQIATLVGSSTNAVEVALHRALARLRTELGAREAGAEMPSALDPAERPL